jgi:DNA-binding NtrC family response regulator
VKQRTDVNAIANSLLLEHPVRHVNKTVGEMSILVNLDETKVLGRDEVRSKIVSKLVNSDTQEKISVLSIVGLGGSGKTTLAKYICQDNKIEKHFEATWWVHVSQEFNVEKLIGKLFKSVSEKSEFHTLQHMTRIISEKLSRRKFLLVLDDVWSDDQHDWEQFEQHFSSGAPGSKILLTTRDGKVAEVVKSADVFSLAFLSDGDGWKLCQQSSGWAEEGLDSDFIEVGKEIVKKCAGVPLAIKSLGGVLRGKRQIRACTMVIS